MKIRGASVLVGCAVFLLMTAPPIHAQRGGGGRAGGSGGAVGGGRGGPGGGRPAGPPSSVGVPSAAPRVNTTTIPSSPILPMTNPVPPIVPTDGTAGTTRRVVPVRPNSPRRDNVIIVGGYGYWPGYYSYPYSSYDGWYPQPYLEPAPVAGELPGTYRYPQPAYDPPASYALPDPPAQTPVVQPESIFYPDQNFIITLPEPDRVVAPPALGTSKVDVLARYGEPWGTMKAGGKETLYFTGGLNVVFENGKVSEIR